MIGDFSFTVDQDDYIRLMKTMSDLSKLEREAVINKGLKEGLTIIKNQGKQNIASSGLKIRTGNLAGSFTVSTKKKDLRGYTGFKRPKGNVAHILDRGTKMRYTKSGASRGMIKGNYFWTKAVEEKSAKAQEELMDSVKKSIQLIINRNSF